LFEPKRKPAGFNRKQHMVHATIAANADEISLHRLLAGRDVLALATESNLRSVVWTVVDPIWFSWAAASGIHAFITNDRGGIVGSHRIKCEGF
jgi:hypothetical protein